MVDMEGGVVGGEELQVFGRLDGGHIGVVEGQGRAVSSRKRYNFSGTTVFYLKVTMS